MQRATGTVAVSTASGTHFSVHSLHGTCECFLSFLERFSPLRQSCIYPGIFIHLFTDCSFPHSSFITPPHPTPLPAPFTPPFIFICSQVHGVGQRHRQRQQRVRSGRVRYAHRGLRVRHINDGDATAFTCAALLRLIRTRRLSPSTTVFRSSWRCCCSPGWGRRAGGSGGQRQRI